MRLFWMALLAASISCGGNNSDGNNTSNGTTNSGITPMSACQTDEDCPGDSTVAYANPDNVGCAVRSAELGGNYCSECVNDSQCLAGFACRESTFCEELPACSVGSDCADPGSEVHKACIGNFCDFCQDDADCEADEVCYSRLCATRDAVDPTCIDVSCEGLCEIQSDGDGVATGISCVE